jgi:hypothetical protein
VQQTLHHSVNAHGCQSLRGAEPSPPPVSTNNCVIRGHVCAGPFDGSAVEDLAHALTSMCTFTNLPGALLVTATTTPTTTAATALAQCAAAATVLAPGGSFVIELPDVHNSLALSAAAFLAPIFGELSFFRPAVAPATDPSVFLVALRFRRPPPDELLTLSQALSLVTAAPATGGDGNSPFSFFTEAAVSEGLKQSMQAAAVWAAERADAEVALLEALVADDTDLALMGMGARWLGQHSIDKHSSAQVCPPSHGGNADGDGLGHTLPGSSAILPFHAAVLACRFLQLLSAQRHSLVHPGLHFGHQFCCILAVIPCQTGLITTGC